MSKTSFSFFVEFDTEGVAFSENSEIIRGLVAETRDSFIESFTEDVHKLLEEKYKDIDATLKVNPKINQTKTASVRILLDPDKIKNLDVAAFYEVVASEIVSDLADKKVWRYDCTKINVANNIQDNFYDFYKSKGADETSITMHLCQRGPKVDKKLGRNEAEVFFGFVEFFPQEKG